MQEPRSDVLQGTLDMLILKALSLGAMHGWGITQRLQQISSEVILVQEGSLYPCLYRLQRKGLIVSEWGVSENNRRARFYRLTSAGRKHLAEETEHWERMSRAVSQVLRHA
jgi:PadR family transcriptional regulator